ncbi:MAG TPA: DNA mismatch repair endonuclease MutL [Candidatus Blautia intestinavium]|nr:DNA mismatch repair endonuclease MutL [Candidatus Blautia intestinavium]
MKRIAVLDQNTIDKIAAGEVVERPSSVVKELVENAIDAGATAVTVEVTDGGKKLIRITDNGSGIEADQIPLAFCRHATSKIEKVEDLEQITSLGFRGEALSSIAAVSQVELITKTPSAITGSRYIIEGGAERSLEELGAPDGSTFLVRNLFYNTPARSKFLKSDMTEANYIHTLMEQLALSHPEISFKYIQNKQVKLHSSGNYNVKDVIYSVYGKDIAKALLEADYENDFMKITGFVGKPEIARGNRGFENYYINGRYVKNNIITKAIENAYRGFLMQHKFPFVSLQMEMEGNDLDVNVHPAKREVRFAREQEVYEAVYDTVRKALTKKEMIPSFTIGKEEKAPPQEVPKPADIPEPFETKRRETIYERNRPLREPSATYGEKISEDTAPTKYNNTEFSRNTDSQSPPAPAGASSSIQDNKVVFSREEEALFHGTLHQASKNEDTCLEPEKIQRQELPFSEPVPKDSQKATEKAGERTSASKSSPKQMGLFEEKLLAPESRNKIRLIGQVFDTYWLVQFGEYFYIIDQHAAHEKIYYEKFVKEFRENTVTSQYLNPPMIVTLNLQEEAVLKDNKAYFRQFGFEIEHFGGKEYCISAVPSNLYGLTEEQLFLDMLDHLTDARGKDLFEIFAQRLATMACKAAVKGNHAMSSQEAEKLIDQLLKLDNPYHCPHGRPTIISMTKTELEKKFKRII